MGKAKEYIKTLSFVGKYLNFEKNGKIKLNYDNGNLMFEGELLKGKNKWKREKNGKLKLEGEYLKRKKKENYILRMKI